jgi:hypothetical protein
MRRATDLHPGLVLQTIVLLLLGGVPLWGDPRQIVDIDEAIPPPAIDGDLGDWAQPRWLQFTPGGPYTKNPYSHYQ